MKLRNKKTGEIKDVESVGHVESLRRDFGYQVTLSWNVMDHLDTCKTYKTLAELNEEWEDYKPVEPLIKDEKIRKAVRAWAETNELKPDYEVKYDADRYGLISWQADISFNFRIEGLEHNKKYTIAELCGEEEE